MSNSVEKILKKIRGFGKVLAYKEFSDEKREASRVAFDQRFLDELAARSDIVDVVGSYVSLSPRGSEYWGCCPFHSEKTPSFHVRPDQQMYYCFGCKKGGGDGVSARAENHAEERDQLRSRRRGG